MPKHCHRNVLVRLDRATFEYNVHLPVIVILSSKLRLMVHLIKVALPTCQDIKTGTLATLVPISSMKRK